MWWKLLLGILLLVLAVLLSHVTVDFQYDDGKPSVKLRILFLRFSLFPRPEKKAETNSKKKRATPKKQSSPTPSHKKKKGPEFLEQAEAVLDFLGVLPEPLQRLLTKLKIRNLSVEIQTGGKDAAEIAIGYGKMCAVVYGSLAALQNIFQIQVKNIHICPDFVYGKNLIRFRFSLKARIGTVVSFAVRYLVQYVKRIMKKQQLQTVKGGVQK